MALEKVTAARNWVVNLKIKKTKKAEMDRHLDALGHVIVEHEELLHEHRALPENHFAQRLQQAREWGENADLATSTKLSVFFAHLDAIGEAYAQMVRNAAKPRRRAN